MFTKAEATAERIASYLEALEAEKEQLGIAAAQEKAAGNEKRVLRLAQRTKANAAEIDRVEKLKGGSKKGGSKAKAEPKAAAGDAGSGDDGSGSSSE